MCHMHSHQQSRSRHKDELQAPETDVWDWKEVVVADVFAAGLLCVTDEVGLLIPPDRFSGYYKDANAEDEEDRQPDLSQAGGVFIYPSQLGIKGSPTHPVCWCSQLLIIEKKEINLSYYIYNEYNFIDNFWV